jgi:hypothetical protein
MAITSAKLLSYEVHYDGTSCVMQIMTQDPHHGVGNSRLQVRSRPPLGLIHGLGTKIEANGESALPTPAVVPWYLVSGSAVGSSDEPDFAIDAGNNGRKLCIGRFNAGHWLLGPLPANERTALCLAPSES